MVTQCFYSSSIRLQTFLSNSPHKNLLFKVGKIFSCSRLHLCVMCMAESREDVFLERAAADLRRVDDDDDWRGTRWWSAVERTGTVNQRWNGLEPPWNRLGQWISRGTDWIRTDWNRKDWNKTVWIRRGTDWIGWTTSARRSTIRRPARHAPCVFKSIWQRPTGAVR